MLPIESSLIADNFLPYNEIVLQSLASTTRPVQSSLLTSAVIFELMVQMKSKNWRLIFIRINGRVWLRIDGWCIWRMVGVWIVVYRAVVSEFQNRLKFILNVVLPQCEAKLRWEPTRLKLVPEQEPSAPAYGSTQGNSTWVTLSLTVTMFPLESRPDQFSLRHQANSSPRRLECGEICQIRHLFDLHLNLRSTTSMGRRGGAVAVRMGVFI